MVDSAALKFAELPKICFEISDQTVSGAMLTAPIDTPRVTVTRTATALKDHTHKGMCRAVAVLMAYLYGPYSYFEVTARTPSTIAITKSTVRGPHREATSSSSSTTLPVVTAVSFAKPGR